METLILFNDNCEEHLKDFEGRINVNRYKQTPLILNNFSILEIQNIEDCEEDEEEIDEEDLFIDKKHKYYHSRNSDEMN